MAGSGNCSGLYAGRDSAAIELIIALDSRPKTIFDDENSELFRTVTKGWFSGERTRYIVIAADTNQSMVGIRCKPGGAYPFFPFQF